MKAEPVSKAVCHTFWWITLHTKVIHQVHFELSFKNNYDFQHEPARSVIQDWHTYTFSFNTHFRIPKVLILWNSEYIFKSQKQLEPSGAYLKLNPVKWGFIHLSWRLLTALITGLKTLQTLLCLLVLICALNKWKDSHLHQEGGFCSTNSKPNLGTLSQTHPETMSTCI